MKDETPREGRRCPDSSFILHPSAFVSSVPNNGLRILFAGGGTGGHLYPALAVAELLKDRHGAECLFVGTDREVEAAILRNSGYRHEAIDAVAGPEMRSRPLKSVWRQYKAVRAARRLIKDFRPHAVVGCGGYSSAPSVLAASTPRLPMLLLEQNLVPGQTTTLLARFADRICVPYEETVSHLRYPVRCRVTGNPVRKEIAALSRQSIDEVATRRLLLILGGSQGSSALNRAVIEAVQQRGLTGWELLHQTGTKDVDFVRAEYARLGIRAEVRPFIDDIAAAYSRAALVICRAGGTTLAELACAHLPAVVLPIPGSVRNHQQLNAQWYAERGMAVVVDASPPELPRRLSEAVKDLTSESERRRTLAAAAARIARPDAAQRVAAILEDLAAGTTVPEAGRRP